MTYQLEEIKLQEKNFLYSQGADIDKKAGCIGHLRGDFGSNGKGFYTTWFDHQQDLKTNEFKSEFDEIVNALRDTGKYGVLKSRSDMYNYCHAHKDNRIQSINDQDTFGFRADTGKHTYFIRCAPRLSDYNFYCYAFNAEMLKEYTQQQNKSKSKDYER
jgi:hypothetical protein